MERKYFEERRFERVRLTGQTLSGYTFVRCEFIACALEECRLAQCAFSECRFEKCAALNPKSEGAQIKYAEFSECDLLGVDWEKFQPSGRFVRPIAGLRDCRLRYNVFSEMKLNQFIFAGSEISDSIFTDCALVESDFRKCRLNNTEFLGCDARTADFREACGYRIDVLSNKLRGARFSLPEAVSLLGGLGVRLE